MMLSTSCHCTRLRRAARTATRRYDDALLDAGLKVTQFSLLRTISRMDRAYITGLAEATGLERSTLGRNLRPLEKAGLVELLGGADMRIRLVRLTARGKRKLAAAEPLWQQAQERMTAELGKEGLDQLTELLDKLAGAAD